ncbi:hypothetical protein [Streptomyces yangpuensis]
MVMLDQWYASILPPATDIGRVPGRPAVRGRGKVARRAHEDHRVARPGRVRGGGGAGRASPGGLVPSGAAGPPGWPHSPPRPGSPPATSTTTPTPRTGLRWDDLPGLELHLPAPHFTPAALFAGQASVVRRHRAAPT